LHLQVECLTRLGILHDALQVLVAFEKHWTKSDKERSYAVTAFVSQLLNSVLVLLLVNAQVRLVWANA
jgi:hypothetical protein